MGLYVDDLIVTGARAEDMHSFKREMVTRYRHQGEIGEGGSHARLECVCLEAVGAEWHG